MVSLNDSGDVHELTKSSEARVRAHHGLPVDVESTESLQNRSVSELCHGVEWVPKASSCLACALTGSFTGISMPMGGYITEGDPLERQTCVDVMSILNDAETAFSRFLSARGQTGNVEDVRDAVMSIALLKVYQSSLGQSSSLLTYDTVDLLGMSKGLKRPLS